MQFTAHCKRKRSSNKSKFSFTPFPKCPPEQRFHGIYTGLCIEVADHEHIKALYDNGCYGKGSKSRGEPDSGDVNETLLLGLEEACFLSYFLQVLVIKNDDDIEMSWESYLEAALKLNERFIEHMAGYLYLKSKSWVIKSGIKFGGHFLIYKQGPRHCHASFLVLINTPVDTAYYEQKNLKGLQRVAETSDKDVLLLIVTQPEGFCADQLTPESFKALTINETVIRRFNYTSFVQSKQQQ